VVEDLRNSLERRLGLVTNDTATITDLHRLTGGASRQTWSFTAHFSSGRTQDMVLRRDPAPQPDSARMALEAAAISEAEAVGVPVPRLIDSGSPDYGDESLGPAYLIMEKIPGESLPRRLLRDERYRVVRQTLAYDLGRVLARVHQIPSQHLPGLPGGDQLDEAHQKYTTSGPPLPILEIAFQYLDRCRPPADRLTTVHGDFRNGNLLIDETGLRAVVDWELVHYGDPMEDLGWACTKTWRFAAEPAVGGFGSREQLFRGYTDECGLAPDPAAVRWWEIFGSLKWAVLCRTQTLRHLSGECPSLELLAIGRRIAECEHDLLTLITGAQATSPRENGANCGTEFAEPHCLESASVYGQPTARELAEGLVAYLSDQTGVASGERRYLNRVAANIVGILDREYRLGPPLRSACAQRLSALGFHDESNLALAIREGRLSSNSREVVEALRECIHARLTVANPGYS
jgi:aminoglycoside phosphotransferase (APT) family kinase protein